MNQITKILIVNGKINIYHSTKIVDHCWNYDIHFESNWSNHIEYHINKDVVHDPTPISGNMYTKMFVPTNRFNSDSKKYINMAIDDYRKKYGQYKWYVEPKIKEE